MTTSTRSFYGPQVLAGEIGVQRWQFEQAQAAGMLPRPAHTRGWTPAQVEQVRDLVPAIVAGDRRRSTRSGRRTGRAPDRPVVADDLLLLLRHQKRVLRRGRDARHR